MIRFKKVQAIPLSKTPAKVLIRWDMVLRAAAEIAEYEFLVLRQSSGQDQEMYFQDKNIDGKLNRPYADDKMTTNLEPISQWIDGLDHQWYLDFSDTLKNLTHEANYRIRCRNKKTLEISDSEQFGWSGDIDLMGLYIVEETNFLLRDVTGVPSLVYQRRRGGIPCTNCFDPIQKKRTSSSCSVCYGTNWVGGFFNPLDTYIDFNPNPKTSGIAQWGEITDNETQCLMSNFPSVVPGDVIKEVRDNRLWRVVNVTVTEKRRCQMLQFARLTEIKSGDIEYTLPYDERFQLKKIDELEMSKRKREF